MYDHSYERERDRERRRHQYEERATSLDREGDRYDEPRPPRLWREEALHGTDRHVAGGPVPRRGKGGHDPELHLYLMRHGSIRQWKENVINLKIFRRLIQGLLRV